MRRLLKNNFLGIENEIAEATKDDTKKSGQNMFINSR